MFRTAVSSGEIWGAAVATSTRARTNKHFMGASGHCERGDYSKNVQWRRMPGQLGSTQSDGGGHPWKCMESNCDPKSASRRCHRVFRLADCAWITTDSDVTRLGKVCRPLGR